MANVELYDDPIWEYTVATRLTPYLPEVRKFWSNIDNIAPDNIGTFNIEGDGVPPGLMYRICNTPVRSPVKHIQVSVCSCCLLTDSRCTWWCYKDDK